jgi:hypothetical protein
MLIIPALEKPRQEDQEFKAKARRWWLTPVILATQEAYCSQEDYSMKSAPGNSSRDPILKISNIKRGWRSDSSGRATA